MQDPRKRKFALNIEAFQPRKRVKTEPGLVLEGAELAKQYVGVGYDKKRNKFTAQRYCNKKRFSGGSFDDAESAARASDELVRKHAELGKNHVLNFPDEVPNNPAVSDDESEIILESDGTEKIESEKNVKTPPKRKNYNTRTKFKGVRWCNRENKWVGDLTHDNVRFYVGHATDPSVIARRLNCLAKKMEYDLQYFNPDAGLPTDPSEIALVEEFHNKIKADAIPEKLEVPSWICQYEGCKKPSKRRLIRSTTIQNVLICGACRSFERKYNKLVSREERAKRKTNSLNTFRAVPRKKVVPESKPELKALDVMIVEKSSSVPRESRSKSPMNQPPIPVLSICSDKSMSVQSSMDSIISQGGPTGQGLTIQERLKRKKILEWDNKDAIEFLEYAGLSRYQKLFKNLEVDGIVLNFLDKEQAKEAGVMGIHCPKLMYKIQEFKLE